MEHIVYLNGALMPLSEASLSPLDYGFLYGYGLFETMRAYSGRVFRLEEHLRRLRWSAELLGISTPLIEDLASAVYDTLEANRLANARVRMTLSAGRGEPIPDISSCKEATLLVTAREYTPHSDEIYQAGYKAIISTTRRNSASPVSSLKSLSYIENMLARREAVSAGADEAILLNEHDSVSEGSTSNIFLVSGGNLSTPAPESGLLPGITRGVVLELAAQAGIQATEHPVTTADLMGAEEVFCTNSVIEIMAVTAVQHQQIGTGKQGPVTEQLHSAYRMAIASETKS